MSGYNKTGSCLCGAIKVTLNAKPDTVAFCFCCTCRRLGGSVGQLVALCDTSTVQIDDPKEQERVFVDHNTDSGKAKNIKFCNTCSVAYCSVLMASDGKVTVVRPSSLNMEGWDNEMAPESGLHVQDRCNWTDKIASL